MKILIVGAGITGLSTYLSLHKHLSNPHSHPHQIILLESHDTRAIRQPSPCDGRQGESTTPNRTLFTPETAGSALGIARNGLACLSRVDGDGEMARRVMARGFPMGRLVFDCARGWTLGEFEIGGGDLERAEDHGQDGRDGKDGVVGEEDQEEKEKKKQLGPMLFITRRALWQELYHAAVRVARTEDVIVNKRLIEIETTESGQVLAHFADGTSDVADLVLGADGIRSTVRACMFRGEKERGGVDYVTPVYEGTAGTGGWLPGSLLKSVPSIKPNSMHFTFGPEGFMGCGYASSSPDSEGLAGWWSTYPRPEPPAADSGKAIPSATSKIDRQTTIDELIARHGDWKAPHAKAIMEHIREHRKELEVGQFEATGYGLLDVEYGTYTVRPLPTWSKWGGRVILLGDAAHALQTSSGQGASQGAEDAESLARILAHFVKSRDPESQSTNLEVVKSTAEKFEVLRRPRVAKIYERSQKMGKMKRRMNLVQEFAAYFFMWLMGRAWLWKLLGVKDGYNEDLLLYDVPSAVERVLG